MEDVNAEAEDGRPDQLQTWLSTIADVNDRKVVAAAEGDAALRSIRTEVINMSMDKEVQNMLLQERYERMDWLSYGNEQKKEGENKFAELVSRLFSLGRKADAEKAARDAAYRADLYKEFKMV